MLAWDVRGSEQQRDIESFCRHLGSTRPETSEPQGRISRVGGAMRQNILRRQAKQKRMCSLEVRAQRKAGDGVNGQIVLNAQEVVRNLLHANCKKKKKR